MLQIKDIHKEYKTGSLVQKALDGVSLNLRDNEFVAILGPSGSGKTTLLNIIGGLDRYDSGDLIINGVSTKRYRDRDWDSYRNHTIGFVFQSYNLIPHQTVLSNVELALTISGISKRDRRQRALDALAKVGLREQAHKKPNQMSGGQMQRVAIARALVNDPDILLADEPTGALDTETSIQVMDLLKEVAKDRLVVMVTHNPELAEEYATRIVKLKDGKIIGDSDPFEPEASAVTAAPVHKNLGKASMSFFTSLALSFNNLWTKKTRTILVAFAGSIGIIGIALILSLSNGVNTYIDRIEAQTLSQYPLSIESSSISFMSMMMVSTETWEPAKEGEVTEVPSVSQLLSTVTTNDLISLKEYFDSGETDIYELTNGVEYSYGLDPQIFRYERGKREYRQVNPNNDFASMGLTSSSVFTSAYSMNVFFEMPENEALYINQYDVKAGRWPENSQEAVLVLTQNGAVSDYIIYAFGLRDTGELDKMIRDFSNGVEVVSDQEYYTWHYEDFMGKNFKVVPAYEFYKYDATNKIYTDMRNSSDYMCDLLNKAQDLKIVGIVQPKKGEDIWMLDSGIYYGKDLVEELRESAEKSDIVKAQLADREVNVLTGVRFDEEESDFDMGNLFSIDENAIQDAFKFDESKLTIDESAFGDMSGMDLSGAFGSAMPDLSADQIMGLLDGVELKIDFDALGQGMSALFTDYMAYASENPTTDFAKLPDAITQFISSEEGSAVLRSELEKAIEESGVTSIDQTLVNTALNNITDGFAEYAVAHGMDLSDQSNYGEYFREYLESDEGREIVGEQSDMISKEITDKIDISLEKSQEIAEALLARYSEYALENELPDPQALPQSLVDYLGSERGQQLIMYTINTAVNTDEIVSAVMTNVSGLTTQMATSIASGVEKAISMVVERIASNLTTALQNTFEDLGSALTIDQDAFADAFQFNMGENELQSFMTEMMGGGVSSAEGNLSAFGYCDKEDLQSITIYPKDFESKDQITQILKDYNKMAEDAGEDDKSIVYTDIVGALMKSVTKIINTISYVLIAFVAISLVVSSIMIGVITYISVLERRKEIGILRAMGASKHNVAQVFNAETMITGFLAGIIGVGISLILLIPINALIHKLAESSDVSAIMPWAAAILLVVLSIVLTFIGGLIPSKSASRQDPVTALRTE
ncbi:ABC transporter ATP-binding protein/permease [Butyrivibrio sp. AE2032]|uniref:ABC transporter ATP-binding protein/permease n=1 Tax=Butyrivibrio sp. AE2032 TaxID=1458463 RepID=UPI000550C8DF|nr:ABC transporter ATP-binding protein/permease [Butyrivibrio sp. AE2032]